ncbi:hypothetical protein RN001_001217 [Aquatica leii]|uniref:DUF4806 domain-containing protein n=1 Tax=Aquatica leii TaxID=1421715 RepID=A0AAN7PNA1_9COLE|nr:hypothetical protein RN001_001217 [Aquatica leii]
MAFVGIEFKDDADEEIALVHTSWLTPSKTSVLWPPYKTSAKLKKALITSEEPNQYLWKKYPIKRVFFTCDDYIKAQKKLKKSEATSDLQTTDVEEEFSKKRVVKKPRTFSSSSSDENEPPTKLNRPPKIVVTSNKLVLPPLVSEDISQLSEVYPSTSTALTTSVSRFNTSTLQNESVQVIATSQNLPSTSRVTHPSNFAEQVFIEIKKIREQLKRNFRVLKQSVNSCGVINLAEDCPVEFPINTEVDLQNLEKYLCSEQKQNELSRCHSRSLISTSLLQQILRKLVTIEKDVKEIKRSVITDSSTSEFFSVPKRALSEMLPAKTILELESFNEKLMQEDTIGQVCTHLQVLGGKGLFDTPRTILGTIIHQDLAVECNWSGKNNKPAFSKFKNVVLLILGAVRQHSLLKDNTQKEVEDIIKGNYVSSLWAAITGIISAISTHLRWLKYRNTLNQWYGVEELAPLAHMAFVFFTLGVMGVVYHTTVEILSKKPLLPVAQSEVISIVWSFMTAKCDKIKK